MVTKADRKDKKIWIIIALIVVVCIAFVSVLTSVGSPKQKKNKALALLDLGDYEAAYELLEEIGEQEAIAASKYDRAKALMDSGDYEAAYSLLNGLNYKDSTAQLDYIDHLRQNRLMKQAEVGSYVYFGSYEQDNNTSNGKEDVEWLVLAKEGDRIFVISRYALDCQQYNSSGTNTTWETSSLRKWLNNAFINNTFDVYEQKMIQDTTVFADYNPSYDTFPGNDTEDRIFLLSISEANQYFGSNEERRCEGTPYCFDRGADKSDTGSCWWWLRSPGYNSSIAAYVYSDGSVTKRGTSVPRLTGAIRPALWINLEP